MKKRRVANGTCFLVPLRGATDYGIGVLARSNGIAVGFGYFFGPRVNGAEDVDLRQLTARSAVLVGLFGDLDLVRGKWPIVGPVGAWDPAEWPVQKMGRIDDKVGRAWSVVYDDATLACVHEEEVSVQEAAQYPREAMMGAGAVEIRLSKLIS